MVIRPLTATEQHNYNLLSAAIQTKSRVSFYYYDDDETKKTQRIVEPFLIGHNKDTGNLQLRTWCLLPESPKNILSWKLFDLEKISGLMILEGKFTGVRPKYNRNDKTMILIKYRI